MRDHLESKDEIERRERRARWICEPGWHTVTIAGYERSSIGRGGSVTFELHDEQGRRQTIRFGLSTDDLRAGRLFEFLAAARGWVPAEHRGCQYQVGRASWWREAVGQRLAILITRDDRGLHHVVGWAAAPAQSPAPLVSPDAEPQQPHQCS